VVERRIELCWITWNSKPIALGQIGLGAHLDGPCAGSLHRLVMGFKIALQSENPSRLHYQPRLVVTAGSRFRAGQVTVS